MREKKEVQIKAIIFDIGGVLQIKEKQRKKQFQKHSSGIHEKAAKKLKIDMDQYFDAIDTAYTQSMEGKITKKQLLKILSFNLKSSARKIENLFYNLYKKEFVLNEPLFQQAKTLQKLGYVITILSDQWHLSKKAHLPKKYFKIFKSQVVSCDVGVRKPNLKIYSLILEKLKLTPRDCLFIDNQEWNIKPAKQLGMKTILFKNNKQLFKEKQWKRLFDHPIPKPLK